MGGRERVGGGCRVTPTAVLFVRIDAIGEQDRGDGVDWVTAYLKRESVHETHDTSVRSITPVSQCIQCV